MKVSVLGRLAYSKNLKLSVGKLLVSGKRKFGVNTEAASLYTLFKNNYPLHISDCFRQSVCNIRIRQQLFAYNK